MFKITGRENPAEQVMIAIKAFGEREYKGNMVDLLDKPYPIPSIDNTKFPDGYMEKKLNCNHSASNVVIVMV
jgi:hypothetical protein